MLAQRERRFKSGQGAAIERWRDDQVEAVPYLQRNRMGMARMANRKTVGKVYRHLFRLQRNWSRVGGRGCVGVRCASRIGQIV